MPSFKDFLSFNYFITKDLMTIFYSLGAIIITLTGIIVIVFGRILPVSPYSDGTSAYIAGAVILTLGNLLWRILCEFVTVVFSIHDKLSIIAEAQAIDDTK